MSQPSGADEARVIVVDDTDHVAEVVAALLQSDGYSVRTANSGKEALALAEVFKPHCVMLDVRMPEMTGLELAQRLRDLYGDDVVLIAMTGEHEKAPEVSQTFGLVDHYLRKPFGLLEMNKVLPPIKR